MFAMTMSRPGEIDALDYFFHDLSPVEPEHVCTRPQVTQVAELQMVLIVLFSCVAANCWTVVSLLLNRPFTLSNLSFRKKKCFKKDEHFWDFIVISV